MQRQFTKDGRVATATSPAESVRLVYDGWQELADVISASEPEPAPEPDADDDVAVSSSDAAPAAKRKPSSSS